MQKKKKKRGLGTSLGLDCCETCDRLPKGLTLLEPSTQEQQQSLMIYPQGLESCLDKACGKRLKIRMRNEMLN